jgi:mannose-6-phosphate isomerase-like protein (cupin superfamily)
MDNAKAPVVVRPGEGLRFGNVEFLALSEDTSRFNLAIVTIAPGRSGPEAHSHQHEDDAFFLLEGELTFTVEDETLAAGPGTLVLVPPGLVHTFENKGSEPARFLNIHAPAGFDKRLMSDD